MKLSYLLVCNFFMLLSTFVYSQSAPQVEWGKIPREDLEMKSFKSDTNAAAIVLYDHGLSKFNDDLNINFERHLRIKILSKQGYDWGTHSIYAYTHEGTERVYDIEAATYILNNNGNVDQFELDDNDIFEEEISDTRTKYSFTLPNLQPGCVIEIKYKIQTLSLFFMRDWTFQHSIPVRWSEYNLITPKQISYTIVSLGYEPYEIQDVEETTQLFQGAAATYLHSTITECRHYHWAVNNLPALRDEPYMTSRDNYVNRIQVQLSAYSLGDVNLKKVLNTWEMLLEELADNDDLIGAIDVTGDVEELTASITSGMTTPLEKMKAIYSWVKNSIVWNGDERVFCDNSVDDIIELKKGSNAEISILLLSMLKSVGIAGDPVMLSTRSNGRIQNLYPIVSQFNYLLTRVKIENNYYFLDATDPLRAFDLLPLEVLNTTGLVVKKGAPEWVSLNSSRPSSRKSVTTINLKEDGKISGSFEEQLDNYFALRFRENMGNKTNMEAGKEYFNVESDGIQLDSVTIVNRDSIDKPIKITGWFNSDQYIQANEDLFYINPVIIHRVKENPFKTAIRNFPIDYAYKTSCMDIINITLPDGYKLKDSVVNKSFAVDKIASYSCNTGISENVLQYVLKFDINETVLKPNYYNRIRNFYSRIVDSHAGVIAVSKSEKANINKLNSAEKTGQ